MHLALAPQHNTVTLRIVDDGQRWIFFHQPLQGLPELDIVFPIDRCQRHSEYRRCRLSEMQDVGGGLSDCEHIPCLDRIKLAERNGIACFRAGALVARRRQREDTGHA